MAGPRNWARATAEWLPLDTLAADYAGPVVFADQDRVIMWFQEKCDRSPQVHKEHVRDDAGEYKFREGGKPVLSQREVTPAWWCPAKVL